MNGTSSFQSRSHNNDLIERAFIKNILQDEADHMREAQQRVLSNAPDENRIDMVRFSRTFSVSEDSLKHTHHIQQRFIDMKRTRYGKQKPLPVHNSILYSHWNRVLYRLSSDLTEAVRSQMAKDLNIELHG